MNQPTLQQRKEYNAIANDSVTIVPIKGTKKSVKLRWMHPYTMERLTKLWEERELASLKIREGEDVLKHLAVEPYFSFKEAALMVLNGDLRIRFFYPFLWRWYAHKYTDEQMADIIIEGKKKLPLMAHYEIMVYSLDMRTDTMGMTKKEAEQYQAERDLAAKRLLSKNSQNTGDPVGGSSVGSETSAIGAF